MSVALPVGTLPPLNSESTAHEAQNRSNQKIDLAAKSFAIKFAASHLQRSPSHLKRSPSHLNRSPKNMPKNNYRAQGYACEQNLAPPQMNNYRAQGYCNTLANRILHPPK